MEKISIFPVLLIATLLLGAAECQGSDAPQFLFVHGGGHGAWCWYKVIALLRQAGFKAATVDLTSHATDKTYADNVTSVAQYAKPVMDYLANVSGKVVLVGHSLGGYSISYAMEEFPQKVSKAIFVAAVMPLNNQSAASCLPLSTFPRLIGEKAAFLIFGNGPSAPPTSLSINLTMATSVFYNKSPYEDATLALSLLDHEPYAPLVEALTLTPSRYGSIRRFYVRTDYDNVLNQTDQNYILNQNPPDQVFFIDGSDHSVFFSKTAQLTALIIGISIL